MCFPDTWQLPSSQSLTAEAQPSSDMLHEASACLLLVAQLLLVQLATPQLQPVALPGAAVVGFGG